MNISIRITRQLLRVSILISALLVSANSVAASLGVLPIRLYLDSEKPISSLTVKNRGDTVALVQSQVMLWTQVNGESVLEPSDDVIVSPPIFEIDPGKDQTVRIGYVAEQPSGSEKTYRLMLSEVPGSQAPKGTGVQVNLRLSLPIFIASDDFKPIVKWSAEQACDGKLRLSADNVGTKHTMITGIKIAATSQADPVHSIARPRYLLAGAATWWDIDSEGLNLPNRFAVVASVLNGTSIEQTVSSSRQVCTQATSE
ncbi:fimbrial biogenesis chaperone [Arenicella xantha]|uniref:Fimbrial chaperone protein n=1 Tax=Arenicella xantha TaxID=644221 RepID=A0A395JLA0_9GAMM|nr:fimbria/pilus periplasmic chaperone [Arenicella xantha]RBP51205.1 fimbrial chaperone protein [Arenicella xantha]